MLNTKEIKVAFFGTSDRSVPILEALNSHFDLVLCITKKDTLVGRKQEVRQTEVKKWAIRNDIDFLEVDTLRGDEGSKVVEKMRENSVYYGIVADFSLMIPSSVIEPYRNKLINIHFSMLPKYRGASPVQFAILNGDKSTGISYQLLEKGMDVGPVIGQFEYIISTKPTSGELYNTLFHISAQKLPDILEKYYLGNVIPEKQDESKSTYTYSKSQPKRTFIFKEDAKIDWSKTAEEIDRSVRAYNPWPIAWTTMGEIENAKNISESNIKIRDEIDRNLKIKIHETEVKDGQLQIKTLQIEGKNKFSWDDFRNGYLKR